MGDWLNALIRDSDDDDSSDDEGTDSALPFVPLVPHPVAIGQPTVSGHRDVHVLTEHKVIVTSPTKSESAHCPMAFTSGVNIYVSEELLASATTCSPSPSTSPAIAAPSPPPPMSRPLPHFILTTHNVVAAAQVPCHVDTREFTMLTGNAINRLGKSVVEKHMRNPNAHIKVYMSGKMTAYGCATPQTAYVALRRTARLVQHLMYKSKHSKAALVQMRNYRVCNVMGSTRLPFAVDLESLHAAQQPITEYEPELATGLIWRVRSVNADGSRLHATLRIQHTGSVVVTGATSCANARAAVTHVLDILCRHALDKTNVSKAELRQQLVEERTDNQRRVAHKRTLVQQAMERLGTPNIPRAEMAAIKETVDSFHKRLDEERAVEEASDEYRSARECSDSLDEIDGRRRARRATTEADPSYVPSIATKYTHQSQPVNAMPMARAIMKRKVVMPRREDAASNAKRAKEQPAIRMIDERRLSSDEDDDFEEVE